MLYVVMLAGQLSMQLFTGQLSHQQFESNDESKCRIQ